MKQIHYYLVLLVVIFGLQTGCTAIDEPEITSPVTPQIPTSLQVVDNQLHIRITPEAAAQIEKDPGMVQRLCAELGAVSLRRGCPYNAKFDTQARKYRLDRWYEATFADAKATSFTTRSAKISAIEAIEPVYFIRRPESSTTSKSVLFNSTSNKSRIDAASTEKYPFNDPLLPDQWHYNNDGVEHQSIAGADINLFKAWKIETGKPSVIVAVIDGGVQCDHPDLAANMWVNEVEKNGLPGVDDDNNGYIDDVNGYDFMYNTGTIHIGDHGTHVAGTVAAVNNNGIGVCGIAGGSGKGDGVRIMSVSGGDMDSRVIVKPESFYYAAINGAVIAQCSFGSHVDSDYYNDIVRFFCEQAGTDGKGNQVGPMKGGIVIIAAGNEGLDYESTYTNLLAFSVGAIGANYKLTNYSNYGAWVDIVAPGGDGYYIYPIHSTVTNNDYNAMAGTSMACPHVSGVAALVISKFGKQGFTPAMLRKRLIESARNIDAWNPNYIGKMGAGLIDAFRALHEPPVIKRSVVSRIEIVIGQTSEVNYTIHSPENYPLQFDLTADYPFVSKQVAGGSLKLTLRPAATDVGTHQLVLRAVDEVEGETTDTLEVVVKGVNSPTVVPAVYPNPVRTQATISLPNRPFTEFKLSLFDAAGRQVISKIAQTSAQGTYILHMQELAAGSYVMVLEMDGQKINKTIVKI